MSYIIPSYKRMNSPSMDYNNYSSVRDFSTVGITIVKEGTLIAGVRNLATLGPYFHLNF